MPGADIERLLRSHWDIADFEVVGLRQVGFVFYGIPTMINLRAEQIARHVYQHHEMAKFYIGVARGYDVRVTRSMRGARTQCVRYDFAVALNTYGKKVATVCLNKEQVHQHIRKDRPMSHDNSEMLDSLNETVERLCLEHMQAT